MKQFFIIVSFPLLIFCGSNPMKNVPEKKNSHLEDWASQQIEPLLLNGQTQQVGRLLDSIYSLTGQATTKFQRYWLDAKFHQKLMENQLDSANYYALKTKAYADAYPDDPANQLVANSMMSTLHVSRKQWDSALHYALEAYYHSKLADTFPARLVYRLCVIYSAIGDRENMRKFAFEGFEKGKDNPYYKSIFSHAIVKYYGDYQEADSAILFFRNIETDSAFYSKDFIAIKHETLGILLTDKNPSEALQHLLTAKPLLEEINRFTAASRYSIANALAKNGEFAASLSYLDSAEKRAIMENDINTLRLAWRLRADNFQRLGQFTKSYTAFDSSYKLYQTEMDSSIAQAAREAAAKYELKEKQDQIKGLEIKHQLEFQARQNQQLITLALTIVLGLLVVIGILLWRRRQLNMQIKEEELRQQLLRSQMDSHFLFNSLTLLLRLIRENAQEKAIYYLKKIASLVRLNLENARSGYITLHDEIQALRDYLDIQVLNFEERFSYVIQTYDGMQDDDVAIPPMLIQPFVENAILHGLLKSKQKGIVTVTITREPYSIKCVIEDNGVGMPAEKIPDRSLSTMITQERLSILSKRTGRPAKLFIENKQAEDKQQGVRVTLEIPFR